MATNWTTEMQGQFDKLQAALTEVVRTGFRAAEARLDERFDERDKRMDERFDERDKRLDERFQTFEDRLSGQFKTGMESLETEVRTVAEAFGATLERIERNLVDLNQKVDTRFADHDGILANHRDRIVTLEQRR